MLFVKWGPAVTSYDSSPSRPPGSCRTCPSFASLFLLMPRVDTGEDGKDGGPKRRRGGAGGNVREREEDEFWVG